MIGGSSDEPTVVRAMDSNSICEGILIHKDIVMTTTHCADVFAIGTTVTIGSSNVSGEHDDFNKVIQLSHRPGYHPSKDDDVMLLKLQWSSSSPVTLYELSVIHSGGRTLMGVLDFIEDGICDLSVDPPESCTPAESRMPVDVPTPGPTAEPDRSCSRLFCCGHD